MKIKSKDKIHVKTFDRIIIIIPLIRLDYVARGNNLNKEL